MGYVSFDRYQSELLFKIIADRSERGSIIAVSYTHLDVYKRQI